MRVARTARGFRSSLRCRWTTTTTSSSTTTTTPSSLNEKRIAELERQLEEKSRRGNSSFLNVLGAVGAMVLAGAFVDETINVVVGIHSSQWDYVEGEVVSEPTIALSGAMLKRREVGLRYRYYVEPGEDDENKDEPGAGHYEEDSVFSTPRRGLMRGLLDYVRDPSLNTHFVHHLAKKYPVGSKVRVFYNQESPGRACLITGLPYPDGPLRLPFYLAGVPFLMVLARAKFPLPVRFTFFAIGVLLWTEMAEEVEEILFDLTPLGKYATKQLEE